MRKSQQRQFCHAVCSALALTLFIFVQVYAASHQLHEELHEDADAPTHQCAATLLSQGQIDTAETAVTFSRFAVETLEVLLPCSPLLPPVAYRFLPGRAPPF